MDTNWKVKIIDKGYTEINMKRSNMKQKKKHPLSWFISRIGKIVYRNDTAQYGLEIKSKNHAKALEMYQNDLDLYYADTPFWNKTL